jgi:hypothetical protein
MRLAKDTQLSFRYIEPTVGTRYCGLDDSFRHSKRY